MTKYKIQNKTDKPDNVVAYENEIYDSCTELEKQLPEWLRDYFIYLKGAVSITTRKAYLNDLMYFINYLIKETTITNAEYALEIKLAEFAKIKAKDVNYYLDYLTRYFIDDKGQKVLIENHNRSLSRKRSSLSVLFKFLYRTEMIKVNITEGFNPIKLPKPQPDAIKRLDIEEVTKLLDAVMTGEGLTDKELIYWKKTRYRDRAILALFITYGLRLKELQQLNISSFNFNRGEFKIYRKRGKEVLMPINNTCEQVIKEYLSNERSPVKDVHDDEALFLSLQNTRMTERAIRELVKKYTSIAMQTDRSSGYSPHKLRATAATSLIEYGFSIYDVQNLMDHDNVTTTQLYAAHKKNAKRDLLNQYELLDSKHKKK